MNKKKYIYFIAGLIVVIVLTLVSFAAKKESIRNTFQPSILSNYPEPLYKALYQYANSNENFNDYFNNLENSDKLYIGGIIKSPMSDENYHKFTDIESKLKYIFGTTLNVEAKDFYPQKDDPEPMLKYNKETDEYTFYDNGYGSGFMTNLGNTSIYNIRQKKVEYKLTKTIVTYYGLYKENDGFFYKITNEKNIERVLEAEDIMEYEETDEEFLANLANNPEDLLIFEYTFTLKNDNYNLIDFRILNK